MLILVSDLHLADHVLRASFDVKAFIQELRVHISRCPPDDVPVLVLLGDVFEMLKTSRWHETELRPWHPHSIELRSFVADIAEGIVAANAIFFASLRELRQAYRLRIEILTGNHDGVLANESGAQARAVLRDALSLEGGQEPFLTEYTRTDHGLWAQHGHEFDAFNMPSMQNPRFVAGDVIVIELVTALPMEVARRIAVQEDDGRLQFLLELDNVVPQDGRGLVAWMQYGVSRLPEGDRSEVLLALKDSLKTCLDRARREAKRYGELSKKFSAFLKIVSHFVGSRGLSAAKQIAKLELLGGNELGAVRVRALSIAATQNSGAQQTFIFVAGHTHLPVYVPMAVGAGRVIAYLNCGTWRRVHLCVDLESGGHAFATYNEESMLIVQKRQNDHSPAYEFRRQVRGL